MRLWIYFIKSAPSLETIPENMEEIPEINQAFNIASQANLTREELENLERQGILVDSIAAFQEYLKS